MFTIVRKYQTATGREPFNAWLRTLDRSIQAKVDAYVVRASIGAARKNIRPLAIGLYEIKLDTGPGYRVYFGRFRNNEMVLLLGGDKSSQTRDIDLAMKYWKEFCEKSKNL